MTKANPVLAKLSETVGVLCVKGLEILVLEDRLNNSWLVPQGTSGEDEGSKATAMRLAKEQLHIVLDSTVYLGILGHHSELELEPEQAKKAGYHVLQVNWVVFDGTTLALPDKPGGVQQTRWARLDWVPTHCPQGYAPLYQGLADAVHGFMRERRTGG